MELRIFGEGFGDGLVRTIFLGVEGGFGGECFMVIEWDNLGFGSVLLLCAVVVCV